MEKRLGGVLLTVVTSAALALLGCDDGGPGSGGPAGMDPDGGPDTSGVPIAMGGEVTEETLIMYPIYYGEYPGAGAADVGPWCMERINWYRAYLGLDPYHRQEESERCAALEARDAQLMGRAHVLNCPGARGQSAGGGWGHPVRSGLSPEIDWREGPEGGHYGAMMQPVPISVACAYYRTSTAEQDEPGDKIFFDYHNNSDELLELVERAPAASAQGSLRAVDVAAGGMHSCALLEDGTVRCWGARHWGQLGEGSMGSKTGEILEGLTEPAEAVPLASAAVDIAAGYFHTCAALDTGEVQCWGANYMGALGDGGDANFMLAANPDGVRATPEPTFVLDQEGSRLNGATRLDAGHSVTCAGSDDGAIGCWGTLSGPTRGQHFAGDDPPEWHSETPLNDFEGFDVELSAPIPFLDAVQLSAGNLHTCGRLADGRVQCVGREFHGQNGDGHNGGGATNAGAWWHEADQYMPQDVVGLTDAVTVAAGGSHTCVLHDGGAVSCWGNNAVGQAGPNRTGEDIVTEPVSVPGISAVAIDAGGSHTCAIDEGATVWCWGSEYYGKLGNGADHPSERGTVVQVEGLSDVVAISTNHAHTCAVTGAGRVYCWGYNEFGQLGDGDTVNRSTPTVVTGF